MRIWSRFRRWRIGCWAVAALIGTSIAACQRPATGVDFPSEWRYPADGDPVTGDAGMVSTTDPLATGVGIEILRGGGNAVDAAVAVAFALAVTHPAAGNLGGGGFMMVRTGEGTVSALDFREKAPAAAMHDMYLDEAGELTDDSREGHLASGVPGSVMGLWEAHLRFGSLPWASVVQPAIDLAAGFVVRPELAASLRSARRSLDEFEASRDALLPGGDPPEEGQILRQPDLARTLQRIGDEGADGFYLGRTAELIAAEMARGGGLMTMEDLRSYTAEWREPVSFEYRGYTVHSMPPSSSGGATMALMAQMLEPHDLRSMGWHSTRSLHLMAEIWRRAYADRNQALADPDFVDVPLARMISRSYAIERAADISMVVATPSDRVGAGLDIAESPETTHLSVVDSLGIAVAITTTLNSSYGSKVTVSGAGFLLNNEMDDFSARPGSPNQFGLVQGEQNAIEPGKRMLSAMTPTIVEDAEGRLFLVAGTPGGSTIITTVFQTIVNLIDFGMPLVAAVNAPRLHHQHLPDEIRFERDGLSESTVDSLEAMGHRVRERGGISGDVQAILIGPEGTRFGHADPRRGGLAAGY